MKKKIVSLLLAATLSLSMLAGCGSSEDASADTAETAETDTSEAAESGEETTESIGAQITVDESATENVGVEGDYSDADLTVFIFAQDHEKAVYQSLIDKFMESTNANVTFEVTTSDEYAQKFMACHHNRLSL